MRSNSFFSDLLWIVLVPPVMTAACWILCLGWAKARGTDKTERVKGWVRLGTRTVFVLMYLIGFGMLAYKYLVLAS